uniref:hypothetical protein n=1 Tax=Xanthomonas oryzae TaxID=347 RepID=UPI003DA06483
MLKLQACLLLKMGMCAKKMGWKKVRSSNGRGHGWPDSKGNVWVPTGPGLALTEVHTGMFKKPGGGYDNVTQVDESEGCRLMPNIQVVEGQIIALTIFSWLILKIFMKFFQMQVRTLSS